MWAGRLEGRLSAAPPLVFQKLINILASERYFRWTASNNHQPIVSVMISLNRANHIQVIAVWLVIGVSPFF